MNNDIKYIKENFIEANELCQIVGISLQELEELIKNELIPNASYKVNITYEISSPLGDEKVASEIQKYFPKSIIDLIKRNRKLKKSSDFKKILKAEFIETFVKSSDNKFGYDGIIKENGSVDIEKLNLAFEEEWQYYLQGIYGICTLNGTGIEIAKKEIAVKKLIVFNKEHSEKKLTDNDKETLNILNTKFNEVSNLFAPYQRESSSRGKYLDKILELNSMSELIKNYS